MAAIESNRSDAQSLRQLVRRVAELVLRAIETPSQHRRLSDHLSDRRNLPMARRGIRQYLLSVARAIGVMSGVAGGMMGAQTAHAIDLPEDRADAMFHSYNGGGVTANGPALLVRKNLADRVSLSASYYVDMVSNASIDVVTTASPYKERRVEHSLGVDYVVRDALISLSTSSSSEPDYKANSASLDIAQEVFGGMTTVNLGFTRGWDTVGKHGAPDFSDTALHWRYRLGATQVLTPRWLMSANVEAIADDGYLGSPYRAARVFGAAIPERDPRTRSSRAMTLRAIGDLGSHDSGRAVYRYFWDNWGIHASSFEFGYSRYVGGAWLGDAYLRFHSQRHALFYSDNAPTETVYISRNRQLSTFTSPALGTKWTYTVSQVPGKYEAKLNGALEFVRYKYSDFTDIRTGQPYANNATVVQMFLSVTY